MALFKRDFNKPGPGVPKNAPKKKGFARFFEILGRDFSNLVKVNLIFFICCLPAIILLCMSLFSLLSLNGTGFLLFALLALVASVPVGPAMTAMYNIINKMLRDDPGFVWHDFKKLFKDNFRSSLIPGLLFSLVTGAQIFAFLFYYFNNFEGISGLVVVALYFFSILVFAMAAPYFFLQAGYLDLNARGVAKNSLLLAIGYAPRSFMGALLNTGLIILQIAFLPFTLVTLLFFGYSIPCLLCQMWIWPPVDKTFKISETLSKRREESLEGIDSAIRGADSQ